MNRDSVQILPLLIPVFVLGFVAYGISILTPGPTPSTAMLAQAAQSEDSSTNYDDLDKKCEEDYSYDCNYKEGYDKKTGQLCAEGLPVQTTNVKGVCMQANVAHAQQYMTSDGYWRTVSSDLPPGLSDLMNKQPEYSDGGLPPISTLNGKYVEEDPFLDPGVAQPMLKADPNSVFNETTGQYDLPPAEPPSMPIQSFAHPPSELNIYNGTPGNAVQAPIPPEYQPSPGQTFSVDAEGNLQQGITTAAPDSLHITVHPADVPTTPSAEFNGTAPTFQPGSGSTFDTADKISSPVPSPTQQFFAPVTKVFSGFEGWLGGLFH